MTPDLHRGTPRGKRCALVTGASSGLGRELALLLAGREYHVLALGRNLAALAALGSGLTRPDCPLIEPLALDITSPAAAGELRRRLGSLDGHLEVLVNNAGVGWWGPFAEAPLECLTNVILVNALGLTQMTSVALPFLRANGGGYILNVASTVGFRPRPGFAVYAATKAYVVSFSAALSAELAGSGIAVTALCPGPTQTAFATRAGMPSRGYHGACPSAPARSVACYGLRALFAKQPLAVPGLMNRLSVWACRLFPPTLIASLLYRREGWNRPHEPGCPTQS